MWPRTPCDSRGDSAWGPVRPSGLPLKSLLKSWLLPGLRGSWWPGLTYPVQPLPSLFCLMLVLSLQHLWVPSGSVQLFGGTRVFCVGVRSLRFIPGMRVAGETLFPASAFCHSSLPIILQAENGRLQAFYFLKVISFCAKLLQSCPTVRNPLDPM